MPPLRSDRPSSAAHSEVFGYFIELDEHGEFFAQVCDTEGHCIWEVDTPLAWKLVESARVADPRDHEQIADYLRLAQILPQEARMVAQDKMEAIMRERSRFKASQRLSDIQALDTEMYIVRVHVRHVRDIAIGEGVLPRSAGEHGPQMDAVCGVHTFYFSDLVQLVADFVPGTLGDVSDISAGELARYILSESALERFHGTFSIKTPELFTITARPSAEAMRAVIPICIETDKFGCSKRSFSVDAIGALTLAL